MSRAHSYSHSRAHSPTFPSLHLSHRSFSNPSVASPTSQLILQPFRCFTYVTAHSPTLLSLLLRRWLFTYVTWQAAYAKCPAFLKFQLVNMQLFVIISFLKLLFMHDIVSITICWSPLI